ncbi:P-II family nitrogen regulator [Lunatimonas lonarensis]|nr:P-II family nitrogen regulator [Lunatimonas lonarensis]
MKFKLIMVLVRPESTDEAVKAMRKGGATGDTIIRARGSGIQEVKTFLGLNIEGQNELILVLSEANNVAKILDSVKQVIPFDEPGNGIAFVLPVDEVVGLKSQLDRLKDQARDSYF